jgi:putative flavoprotein involved in K+ transport
MSRPDVLVIGAGPSGLAVSACLTTKGIAFALVDRHGDPGGAYARAYARTQLASPVRYNQLPGLALDAASEYVDVAAYSRYLRSYAERFDLRPQVCAVDRVQPAPEGFRVRFAGQAAQAAYRCVIVATGMFDFPHWPDIPGLAPSARTMHVAHWRGCGAIARKRPLIIGGATSAVEIAEECAKAGVRSVVSVRRRAVKIWPQRVFGRDIHDYVRWFESLPRGFMRAYCAGRQTLPATDRGFGKLRRAGLIEVRGPVARIDEDAVIFRDGVRERFDVIVCATGYRHDTPFLAQEARAADACESRLCPGLFLLGSPCARRLNSAFLRGIAADAQAIAQRIASCNA